MTQKWLLLVILLFYLKKSILCEGDKIPKVARITDIKQLKSLLKQKNNVLVYYYKDDDELKDMLIEVADNVYGKGSIAFVDCNTKEGKSMCKSMKATPNDDNPYYLKHYSKGDFNKDYDRKVTVSSISKFLEEPFADLPWNEDTKLKDVLFVENKEKFDKLIKKKLPTLVLFYAPWCGHCKNIRPIYGEVASDRKGETILAAVDMNTAKGKIIGEKYHITGFPTLYYFDKGEDLYPYGGPRTKNDIIAWLQNPTSNVKSDGSPKDTKKVSVWAENVFTNVEHLTEKTFEHYIKKNNKVLIVFHANWCKHSQNLQPIIEKVAEQMKGESMKIVAVDGAAHNTIVKKYKVDGYPKLYFFENGKKAYEVFARKVHDIIFWAKNPKKPQLPEKSWDLKNTNVVVLNKENFDDTMDLTRHAFIVFYAPWCEHCKHMKSEYVKFADMTKDKNAIVATVNCDDDKDLCRRQLVGAYPQLRYYFNGEHKEDFRKARTAKEMHAFFWMKIREYDEKEAEKNEKSSKSKPGKDEL